MDWQTFNLSLGLHFTMYLTVALYRVIHKAMREAANPGS